MPPMPAADISQPFVDAKAVIAERITQLEAAKADLIAYLRMKITVEDWHACQDAASDIREIDAKLDVWRSL